MNSILEVKNYLIKTECSDILNIMNQTEFDNDRQPSHWVDSIKRIKFPEHLINAVTLDLQNTVQTFYKVKFKKQHNLHTVVWNTGKSMLPWHIDYGAKLEFPERDYVSLIYLNDDYEGGELSVPSLNFEKKPERGTLISFRGGDTPHAVKTINSGTRYTIICWWNLKD